MSMNHSIGNLIAHTEYIRKIKTTSKYENLNQGKQSF